MEKKIYLNEIHTSKIVALLILGVSLNKAYVVLEERKKIYKSLQGESYKSRYKIKDDYGNVRWVDSVYFLEADEFRHEKIKRILD